MKRTYRTSKEFKFQLNSQSLVAGAIGVVVVLLMGYRDMNVPFDEQGKGAIRRHLQADYARRELPKIKDITRSDMPDDQKENMVEQYLGFNKVELKSVEVHRHRWNKERYVAKVDVSTNGTTPPDGKGTRYLELERGMMTGWTVRTESSAAAFKASWFSVILEIIT